MKLVILSLFIFCGALAYESYLHTEDLATKHNPATYGVSFSSHG